MPAPTLAPSATPTPAPPVAEPNNRMNVRQGPGTNYPVVGTAPQGESLPITGKNANGSWWEVSVNARKGWVAANLVTASGDLNSVSIVANIPPTTADIHPNFNPNFNPKSDSPSARAHHWRKRRE